MTVQGLTDHSWSKCIKCSFFPFLEKKMPDHRLNLKSIWDRTVQIVTKDENTAGWRGLWWMAQFSFQPFPCMLVNQRENLLLDQDPLWASHLAPLCGWVSTPAPFSHNYDCGSGYLISEFSVLKFMTTMWGVSVIILLVLGFGLEVFLQVV